MKFCECFRKAFRSFITVFQRHIDHLAAALTELLPGQGQPPHADILSERITAQQTEQPLKMIARKTPDRRNRFEVDRFRQMLLDVVERLLNPGNIIHTLFSHSGLNVDKLSDSD